MRPSPNSIFNCHNPKGVKVLTRFRLGLSHLRDHKFKYSFQDSLNPICNCRTDVGATSHYPPHSAIFAAGGLILISGMQNIDNNILSLNDSTISRKTFETNSSFHLKLRTTRKV